MAGQQGVRFEPQLATLTLEAPPGSEWLHEVKFDGHRLALLVEGGKARLLSRTSKDATAKYPEVVRAARGLRASQALLDGEVAAVLPNGRTSLQALQNAASGSRVGLTYFAFDLLQLDGVDTAKRPIEERKELLRELLVPPTTGVLRYADHVVGQGPRFFEEARRLGLEGIVSKRLGTPYRPGRGPEWLKLKVLKRQEFLICGFIPREGSKNEVGSLVLGVHAAGGARAYCGRVGSGFGQKLAEELYALLRPLAIGQAPFDAGAPDLSHHWTRRGLPVGQATWTRPEKICEVSFVEWSDQGVLRNPTFEGLRDDKSPGDVVREG